MSRHLDKNIFYKKQWILSTFLKTPPEAGSPAPGRRRLNPQRGFGRPPPGGILNREAVWSPTFGGRLRNNSRVIYYQAYSFVLEPVGNF